MIKQQYLYPGNGPPCPEASNKGDPAIINGLKGDPHLLVNAGGNHTPLAPKINDTINSCFFVSFKRDDATRNTDCPK